MSKKGTIYYAPSSAVIRLEAIWTVKIAYARFASASIRHLLGSLASVLKQDYQPVGGRMKGGHFASLAFYSMEQVIDSPETTPYPDW